MQAPISHTTNYNIHQEGLHGVAETLYVRWLASAVEEGCSVASERGCYVAPGSNFAVTLSALLRRELGASAQCIAIACGNHLEVVALSESPRIFCIAKEDARVGARSVVRVSVSGEAEAVARIVASLRSELEVFHSASIRWWYNTAHGPTYAQLVLDEPRPIVPQMYPLPQFNGDPAGYMREYLAARASVLYMVGPPGTGKTSLLRDFVYRNELGAAVAYSEDVLADDQMFIDFLRDDEMQVLILEDVTELLTKRDLDKNSLMARFLNVSDGLVQPPRKKIVFTTNMHSLDKIDPALLRPGRCYGVLEFRELTPAESQVACTAADLPFVHSSKHGYTMSELYNQEFVAPEIPRIGLVR